MRATKLLISLNLVFLASILTPNVLAAEASGVTLALGSASVALGGTVTLPLTISSTASSTTTVEWTINFATVDVSNVNVTLGAAGTAASKSILCNKTSGAVSCIVYGTNHNVIPDGVLANVAVTISPGSLALQVPIALNSVLASEIGARSGLATTAIGNIITLLVPTPVLSSVSCSPTSVTAPGTSLCTATATALALLGGVSVSLSSNNTNVTVPSSVSIPFGAISTTFTATVGAITANQSAVITAIGGATKTASLTLVAPRWSISGTLGASGSGATVALTGAATASATADASGNYSFASLANGSYTVTPTKAGFSFTPASRAVTVNGASQTAINFTAAAQTWTISGSLGASGASATIALTGAATKSTTADASGNYSFTSLANGSYTVTPTKAGFSFTPASRAVTVNGANQTTINFTAAAQSWSISGTLGATGASATVALTGAATKSTTADASGNYSFTSLANGSYTVTPTKAGASFNPVNRAVTINGANQTAIDFTTSTQLWSITGNLGANAAGATVALTGTATKSATADASGNYSFASLANGSYTITPTKAGIVFTPLNKSVTINGANLTAINFVAAGQTWSISGSLGTAGANSTLVATGVVSTAYGTSSAYAAVVTADASGNYSFPNLSNSTYTISPIKPGFYFSPTSKSVTVNGANRTGINFSTLVLQTVTGTLGSLGAGATVVAEPTGGTVTPASLATADEQGNFTVTGLAAGKYVFTPSKPGVVFEPASTRVNLNSGNPGSVQFTSSESTTTSLISLDAAASAQQSISSGTVATPPFSTASPNELLLAFISADHTNGTNTLVTGVSGGELTWTQVAKTNAATGNSEIWRAFATQPLTNIAVNAKLSQQAASSISVVSFQGVDASMADGSGAIGAIATQSGELLQAAGTSIATTRAGSLVVGVGSNPGSSILRTPASGQAIMNQGIVSGNTYWVQRYEKPIEAPGSSATLSNSVPGVPTSFNLAVAEVLPALSPTKTREVAKASPKNQPAAAVSTSAAVPVAAATDAATAQSLIISQPEIETGRVYRAGDEITFYAAGLDLGADLQKLEVVFGSTVEPATATPVPDAPGLVLVRVVLPSAIDAGQKIPLYIRVILPDGSRVASNAFTIPTAGTSGN